MRGGKVATIRNSFTEKELSEVIEACARTCASRLRHCCGNIEWDSVSRNEPNKAAFQGLGLHRVHRRLAIDHCPPTGSMGGPSARPHRDSVKGPFSSRLRSQLWHSAKAGWDGDFGWPRR